jgi:hypothetical protein
MEFVHTEVLSDRELEYAHRILGAELGCDDRELSQAIRRMLLMYHVDRAATSKDLQKSMV